MGTLLCSISPPGQPSVRRLWWHKFGRTRRALDRIWPKLSRAQANFGGRSSSNSRHIGGFRGKFGRFWANVGRASGKVGRFQNNVGRSRAKLWPTSSQPWPIPSGNLAERGPNWAISSGIASNSGPKLNELPPVLAQFPPTSAWANSAKCSSI